tara:strand:+ start:5707 stop:5820 length:114 start_codon:yes stop_codon:yes gene_type:complete
MSDEIKMNKEELERLAFYRSMGLNFEAVKIYKGSEEE